MEINFEHRTAAHCENGVTANILRYYGYDCSEPLVFGLSASLYFVHLPFIRLSGFPVTSIRPLPGMIFTRATQALGFKIQKKLFFIKRRAEEELDRLLDAGIPTGCIVGMYHLPYMPPEYRFPFNAHNICVTGREDGEYIVSDPVVSGKVRISADDLRLARFAREGYPVCGLLYHVRSLPDSPPDMNLAVRRAILQNCYRMLRQPGIAPFA
ncbi:MAG: BtrH N-terminal domain-containing protein, partial [Tannerella sp.]|nr:BtrH N-terminal domain-containing protein [Tannerella sp.]